MKGSHVRKFLGFCELKPFLTYRILVCDIARIMSIMINCSVCSVTNASTVPNLSTKNANSLYVITHIHLHACQFTDLVKTHKKVELISALEPGQNSVVITASTCLRLGDKEHFRAFSSCQQHDSIETKLKVVRNKKIETFDNC